jgi:hypothetical protein
MHIFAVERWGSQDDHSPRGSRIYGFQAPGPGVLVVHEGLGWVRRQDGARATIQAKSVVVWNTGEWVEYGSDGGGFKVEDYWAADLSDDEHAARLAAIFGPESVR